MHIQLAVYRDLCWLGTQVIPLILVILWTCMWKCREGHEFALTPYTVLKGGYWCPHCCEPKPWKYGAVADIPFYGQVYFDSHDKNELNDVYPVFDHEEDFIIKK